MGGRYLVNIYLIPAIIALVASALAGWFYLKSTLSAALATVAFVASFVAIDPYRVKAIQTSAVCIQDSGCQSTGLVDWILAMAAAVFVCILVGLLFAGAAKFVAARTEPIIGSRPVRPEFYPDWPKRPHWAPRKRH